MAPSCRSSIRTGKSARSIKHDLAALADLLAERLDRITSGATGPPANIDRLQTLLPGLIPSWGVAAGRHVIVTGADQRVLARVPDR